MLCSPDNLCHTAKVFDAQVSFFNCKHYFLKLLIFDIMLSVQLSFFTFKAQLPLGLLLLFLWSVYCLHLTDITEIYWMCNVCCVQGKRQSPQWLGLCHSLQCKWLIPILMVLSCQWASLQLRTPSDVGGRPHLSSRYLPFASITHLALCLGQAALGHPMLRLHNLLLYGFLLRDTNTFCSHRWRHQKELSVESVNRNRR